ncbi:hypothetical protein [Mycobacterium leprae]|uniref:hypothetical protein n=1 Tax=Mycobacterium leprae TaxID=1769 RepID=UPI000A97BEE7|nr:hypothetical protein [Mycobacterium leprae]
MDHIVGMRDRLVDNRHAARITVVSAPGRSEIDVEGISAGNNRLVLAGTDTGHQAPITLVISTTVLSGVKISRCTVTVGLPQDFDRYQVGAARRSG